MFWVRFWAYVLGSVLVYVSGFRDIYFRYYWMFVGTGSGLCCLVMVRVTGYVSGYVLCYVWCLSVMFVSYDLGTVWCFLCCCCLGLCCMVCV